MTGWQRYLFLPVLVAAVAQGQTISTYAGTGTCCADPDNVPATSAYLQGADGLAIDGTGNLYIWEVQPFRVRKVSPSGIITTVAGVYQSFGSSGDGGPATSALLQGGSLHPGLAVDSAGNLYISDGGNHRIRKVNPAGIISTFAGNGTEGFSGDGGLATSAQLAQPNGIALDAAGNLYIADSGNQRVRKVTPAGIISTVAGDAASPFSGDGGPAVNAGIERVQSVAIDNSGTLYLTEGRRIRKVDANGIITTIAGTGTLGNGGDGGPATSAQFRGAAGMAFDRAGNLFIADVSNQRIRKIDTAGIITNLGGSTLGFAGDGGPVANAQFRVPHDVVFDAAGNLYISDTGNFRIRKVAASGPALVPSPGSLTFSFTQGSATAPAAQSVSVTSTGAPLTFNVSSSTSTGGGWLSVNVSNATTPATLQVSVTPGTLAPGTYSGTVTLTPAGGSPQNVGVTFTVTGQATPVFVSTGVVNALGYQNKLAPGVVFVIFGRGLGGATLAAGAAPDYPALLAGTSITFTPATGGTPIQARMIYTLAGQISGFLPSSTAPGTYAVRVTYNGQTSAPQNVTVVARSLGIATANSSGAGVPQATIGNVNGGVSLTRFTSGSLAFNGLTWTLTPAHAGDTLVFWGTGGGADAANDSGSSSGDQTAAGNFRVIVGGRSITPLYAGTSAGYPGLWQINFVLPSDVDTGCSVSAQVSAGGELSNVVTLPIAEPGQSACSDPNLSPAVLAKLDAGGTITGGAFAIAKMTEPVTNTVQETASGFVGRWTAAAWAIQNLAPRFGNCTVYDRTYPLGGLDASSPSTTLNAGARLGLSGPNLAAGAGLAAGPFLLGTYYGLSMTAGTVTGGSYTLTGSGGAQVGPFTTSTIFPTSFTATNFGAITLVDRSRPLTFTWSGSGIDRVYIQVNSATTAAGNQHIVTISCYAPGSLGTFSVPTAALAYLQPAAAAGASFGGISIQGLSAPGTFTATLADGGSLDFGAFSANLGAGKNVAIQ
ncbi:MAG: hypothetical protein HYX27_25225 [Acidobacteria bacterium]|nr:hypothetical protein [Acidobacteriota bacterium]